MIVPCPSHEGQRTHGNEHDEQAPKVDRPEIRESTTARVTEHRSAPGDYGSKPEQNMVTDDCEKDRIGRWDRDIQNDVVPSFSMPPSMGLATGLPGEGASV